MTGECDAAHEALHLYVVCRKMEVTRIFRTHNELLSAFLMILSNIYIQMLFAKFCQRLIQAGILL